MWLNNYGKRETLADIYVYSDFSADIYFFRENDILYILTGIGWNPPMDEMKTIDPLPWFCIWGTTDLANKNEAFTLTSNILSHASSLHWKKLILNNNFPWKWHKLLAIQSVH